MKLRFWFSAFLLASLVYPLLSLDLSQRESGEIANLVGRILSSNHLRQEVLNNRLSALALDNYLDALDVNHQIFLASDIREFREKYSDQLDDLTLQDQSAEAAFEIYKRYLSRLGDRIAQVPSFLESDHDFFADEVLEERSEKPWPENEEEASELWRKRIKADILQGRLQDEDAEMIRDRLTKRYARLHKRMEKMEADEILQIYLSSIGAAYDPHSNYMSPSEAENFRINNVKLELSGIGARLSEQGGYCKIVSLVPGGPAARSKQIKPGDRIIAVAQAKGEPVNVVEMKLGKVVQMIRGETGTEVRLTVASSVEGSEHKVVSLIRDVIELKDQQVSAKIIDHQKQKGEMLRLGIIDLPQYYESSADDVRKIIDRLKAESVDGILLDLRKNGGGILEEAIKITGLFFPEGPVVQVRDFRDSVNVLSDKDPETAYEGPLVVLVSRLSASASEITAAALQDYERAVLVGDQSTHGKGTVQTLHSLNNFNRVTRRFFGGRPKDFGMLKYTISKFYRVKGTSTQKYGVRPDIVLPSVYDYMEFGEEHLSESLEPDKVRAASFDVQNQVEPYLSELKIRSNKRVGESTDFAYVREDIDNYIEMNERESLSLNEQFRLEKKAESKARIDRRNEERDARPAPNESVFLLSLDATENVEALIPLPYLAATRLNLESLEDEKNEDHNDHNDHNQDSEIDEIDEIEKDHNDRIDHNEIEDSEIEDSENQKDRREYDPHLREALNILADYIDAIERSPTSNPKSDLS